MQELDRSTYERTSQSNADQVSVDVMGISSQLPPALFSSNPVQAKLADEDLDIEKSSTSDASLDIDQTPTEVVQQKPVPVPDEEVESAEPELNLEYASTPVPPPSDHGKNGSKSEAFSLPLQKKESNISTDKSARKAGVGDFVMEKMEQSFGADFSDVKINTNSSSASDLGALAYTQGNQIDFAPGQYNPSSQAGQELLGHELTHVVQQREGRVKANGSIKGQALNDDAGLEKEADDLGKKAASGSGTRQRKKSRTIPSTGFGISQYKFDVIPFPIQRQTGPEDTTPVDVDEEAIAKELVAKGAKNENYVTDEVFYKRYPGIHRRKLIFPNNTDAETALVRDWLRIRNDVVRPILAGEEIPEKDKPGNDKPEKEKPKKEQPEKEQPGKGDPKQDKPKEEDPKKEQPKEEKPKKEEPKSPGLDSLIPDLLGITPSTFNLGLDAIKAASEMARVIPGVGMFTGVLAGSIQMYQDLMTSIQTGDVFLGGVTLLRNSVNLVNGLIGDVSYLITALQDAGLVATAGSTATGPGVAIAGTIEGFIVFCNEIVSILNFILDLVMLFLDTLVVVHTTLKLSLVPMNEDEIAAHKNLRVGYIGNGAADLISTFLDGLDVASAGLLHGEVIEKFAKAYKGMSFLQKFGIKALGKLDEILAGIIIPGEVNLIQGKREGEELEDDDENGLEELLGTFVLANQKFESLDGGAKALLDMWPTFVEQMEAKIEEMSDGREPFEVAQEMFDQALAEMEMKITSMTFIQDQLTNVDNNILTGLAEIEKVESMIDQISIPEVEVPDIDLGDNPIADGLEGVLETGADVVAETLNKGIRLANQELDKIKDSMKAGIVEFKEELLYFRLVIEESQKVLSSHKEELRDFINTTREQLADCGSFEDLFDKIIGEIGKVLGLEGEIDVDTLREEWDETKTAVAEALKKIQDFIAGNVKESSSESTSETSQMKSEEDLGSLKIADDPSDTIQKKKNQGNGDNSEENTSLSQGAFQLKTEVNSPTESSKESFPFQLKPDGNRTVGAKHKELDLPFAL